MNPWIDLILTLWRADATLPDVWTAVLGTWIAGGGLLLLMWIVLLVLNRRMQ